MSLAPPPFHAWDEMPPVWRRWFRALFDRVGGSAVGGSTDVDLVALATLPDAQVTATGSTTPRTLAEWHADEVNVKAFGAVGDGVTDDTAAINAALTAGAGKTVRLADGATYLITGNLTPSSDTRIIGRATIKATASSTVTAMLDLSSVSNVTIQDLEIDGNTNAGGTVGGKFGVRITQGTTNRIVNVEIHDTWGNGIKIDGGTGHSVLGGSVIDCGRDSTTEDQGIAVMAVSANLTAVRVTGVHVGNANRKGISTYAAIAGGYTLSDVSIVGNTVQDCGLGGIFVAVEPTANQSLGVTVSGNTVSGSYGGIVVASVTGATVTGNTIRGSTHVGMDIDGVIGGSIIGNTIDGSAINGLHVTNSAGTTRDLVIAQNVVTNSNTSEAVNGYGIQLNNATYCIVANNVVADHDASPTPSHGIVEDGSSDYNQILDNVVLGTVSGASTFYSITGTHTRLRVSGTPSAVGFTPANGATVIPDTRVTETFTYTAGPGVTAVTVGPPTTAIIGLRMWVTWRNTSGGPITITWDAIYKVAWTDPPTNKRRTAVFSFDGTNMVQERVDADVPS